MALMNGGISLFSPGSTPLHRCDARSKLVALIVLSVAVFFVETWRGLGLCFLIVVLALAVSRAPVARMAKLSIPVGVMLAVVVLFNSFSLDVSVPPPSLPATSAGIAAGAAPLVIVGPLAFLPEGCIRALFLASRILLILFATFTLVFTTSTEETTKAFARLLSPLAALRVPVDDVASTLTLALCFIPQVADEWKAVSRAQRARGADFASGGPLARVVAQRIVFVPVVVSLFRRAETVATAMDARCYGASRRTCLHRRRLRVHEAGILAVLCVVLVTCACVW